MGCFLGCFRGKKGRKHKASSGGTSNLQEPFGARSVPVLQDSTGSLPSEAFSEKTSIFDDLFASSQVRAVDTVIYAKRDSSKSKSSNLNPQVQSSFAIKLPEGGVPQETVSSGATENTVQVKKSLQDPWIQVDELQEELEELRRKFSQESEDAKKWRNEVKYLRLCGPHNPVEVKRGSKNWKSKASLDMVEDSGDSWLFPPGIKTENGQVNDFVSTPGLADESCDLLQGCSTPGYRDSENETALTKDPTKKRKLVGSRSSKKPLKTVKNSSKNSKGVTLLEGEESLKVHSLSLTQKRQKSRLECPIKTSLSRDGNGVFEEGDHIVANKLSEKSSANCYAYEQHVESISEASTSFSDSCISSEESGSDIAPVHCLSPPFRLVQQRHFASIEENSCYSESVGSATGEEGTNGKNLLQCSAQSSQKKHCSEQEFEEFDSAEDDSDLFLDAVSHLTTECSIEKENPRYWHSESVDSLDQLDNFSDASFLSNETHLNVSNLMQTQGRTEKIYTNRNARPRNKPESSVLTPVENLSQWKQLKEDNSISEQSPFMTRLNKKSSENDSEAWINASSTENQKVVARAPPLNSEDHGGRKKTVSFSDASISFSTFENTKGPGIPDLISVDTSLSCWIKPSFSSEDQSYVSKEATENDSRQEQTLSPKSAAFPSPIQTPTWRQGHQSPAKTADERPILGTVAAHWSDLPTVQKWWDGKGIPNSTNKYKEDQKVSWHTTPFEVRLEHALAKQGLMFQKELFGEEIGSADANIQAGSKVDALGIEKKERFE